MVSPVFRADIHRAVSVSPSWLEDLFERIFALLRPDGDPTKFHVYCSFLHTLSCDFTDDEDFVTCRNFCQIIDFFDFAVNSSDELLMAIAVASQRPNFPAIASTCELGPRLSSLLAGERPAGVHVIVLSLLSVIFESLPAFPVDLASIFGFCKHDDVSLRSSALFCIGNLCESSPDLIGAFLGNGLGQILRTIIDTGCFFERAEAAILLATIVVAGGVNLGDEFSGPFMMELFASLVETPGNCLMCLPLEAIAKLLQDAIVEGGEELGMAIAADVDLFRIVESIEDTRDEREQAAIARIHELLA
jgi:hypothetical protein